MVKVLIGYDLPQGLSEAEHYNWLRNTHLRDMARVPGLEKVVLNRTRWIAGGDDPPGYVAELQYPDMETYRAARDWLKVNPFPPESRPEGRLKIKFLIICDSELMSRG